MKARAGVRRLPVQPGGPGAVEHQVALRPAAEGRAHTRAVRTKQAVAHHARVRGDEGEGEER